MRSDWTACKKILCIRPDNMGDLIMSGPALRALKESFGCTITLLTSVAAAALVPFIPEVDEVMAFDLPWVKAGPLSNTDDLNRLVEEIREQGFDAAVIFTVFSQNPLPSALIAYQAGIPRRLAYCRENPYGLLTHWVPDKEPYCYVQHQVLRDLRLVEMVGARTEEKKLHLRLHRNVWPEITGKLSAAGVDLQKPWLLVHAGVSESKREYPLPLWRETVRMIGKDLGYQVILTGSGAERKRIEALDILPRNSFNLAGLLSLEEFITLVKRAPVVVSVNTGTIHIAAAMGTPVVVLYALSNPQHSPWMSTGRVLLFDIPEDKRSKNEVLQYVHRHLHPRGLPMVMPEEILLALRDLLDAKSDCFIPDMIPLQTEQVF